MQKNLDIIYDILGFKFNKEREELLTDFKKSFQVQACPGSGKTTLLVAKLMLLAQDIDFAKGTVCILTHTNVAIDEIKRKIKKYNKPGYENFISNVNRLFKYPNFVGTTQSFLDKYLGIPGYIQEYGYRPNTINDDVVISFSVKEFFGFEKGTRYYLNSRTNNNDIGIEKVFDTSFNINSNQLILSSKFGKKPFGEKSETYKLLLSIKIDQIKNHRLLKYKEIDYFSLYYLENTKSIKRLLQNRFKYIFIDEIQDTNSLHKEILNKLFEGGDNIIQGFGDYNQEILEDEEGGEFRIFGSGEVKDINDSMRLSPLIANNVKNICISPQELKGYGSIDIPIYFIIFDEERIDEVILNYIEIIKKYDFSDVKDDDLYFKAVGYIQKEA